MSLPVEQLRGILNVHKPSGITSYDVIRRVKTLLPGRIRIGHAGTLDPLASGVLLVLLGAATKVADYLQSRDKEYEARVLLGQRTATDDITGAVREECPVPDVSPAQLLELLRGFEGEIEQTPPAYSALKVDGIPAYDLARAGSAPELRPRRVRIYELALTGLDLPVVSLRARVGKGCYIRALARDIGERLGCGATLQALTRTRSGSFQLEDAIPLDALEAVTLTARLVPIDTALDFLPRACARPEAVPRLRNGIPLAAADLLEPGDWPDGTMLRLTDPDSRILAISQFSDGTLRTMRGIYADT